MDNKLSANKVLDAHNVTIIDGVEYLNAAGTLRLLATADYHNAHGSEGRRKAAVGLDRLTAAAAAKGFTKADQLRSAFAEQYPPTAEAKTLADEMAACLGKGFFEALSD